MWPWGSLTKIKSWTTLVQMIDYILSVFLLLSEVYFPRLRDKKEQNSARNRFGAPLLRAPTVILFAGRSQATLQAQHQLLQLKSERGGDLVMVYLWDRRPYVQMCLLASQHQKYYCRKRIGHSGCTCHLTVDHQFSGVVGGV